MRLPPTELVIIFSVILTKLSYSENMIFPLYITKRGNIKLYNLHFGGNIVIP